MTRFADLHNMHEDDRIELIGEVAASGRVVGVFLEKNEPEKIARYIKKVTERFPHVVLLDQMDGPTKSAVTLRFGSRQ